MFTLSLESQALAAVITWIISAVDVSIPSVVPHPAVGVGDGDKVETFNGGFSSKSLGSVLELPLISSKNILSTLVSSLLLTSNV